MPAYKITISRVAQKQLDKLPDNLALRLVDSIYTLANEPRPTGCKKLKGREGYRIRVGDYRIIYEIIDDMLIVNVVKLGHRKDIYN
ncbi:type II toxin-antitoxin system RelE family toxin [Mucilaginibacter sp. UYCu711]|uniref:type II toxin-antitoxin system RelE family toxin n=1 Tax=Mucilaginibacter sp. UYCu711 TaxID=3156339 RepID=UPI003D23046B